MYRTGNPGCHDLSSVRCRMLETLPSHVVKASPTAITSTEASNSTSFLGAFHDYIQNSKYNNKGKSNLFPGYVLANQKL